MIARYRRCARAAAIFAVLGFLSACAGPSGQGPGAPRGDERPGDVAAESPSTQPTGEAREEKPGAVAETGGEAEERLEFKLQPGDVTYYLIEREVRDLCGFPPLLTVRMIVREKRFITQRVLSPQESQDRDLPANLWPWVSWECQRYEVRERGMKDEVTFDSLRDLYPPPSLWALGDIPGSTCSFALDPRGGVASKVVLSPAKTEGSPGMGKPSRAAERCLLTPDNVKSLVEDLGAYYLPDSPQPIGGRWTKTYHDDQKNLGLVTTKLTGELRSVRKNDGQRIGVIDISSEISLEDRPAASAPANDGPRRPGATTQSSKEQKYKLDKAKCQGTVEFNIDRGELASLSLYRELEWVAELEQPASQSSSMMVKEIRLGSAEDLRVTASHTPPVMPVIVGGKKPPVAPDDGKPKTPATQPAPASEKQSGPAAGRTSSPQTGTAATQPGAPTTRPATTPTRRQNGAPRNVGGTSRPSAPPKGPVGRPRPGAGKAKNPKTPQ